METVISKILGGEQYAVRGFRIDLPRDMAVMTSILSSAMDSTEALDKFYRGFIRGYGRWLASLSDEDIWTICSSVDREEFQTKTLPVFSADVSGVLSDTMCDEAFQVCNALVALKVAAALKSLAGRTIEINGRSVAITEHDSRERVVAYINDYGEFLTRLTSFEYDDHLLKVLDILAVTPTPQ
jgi:hypothetical protein